MNTRYYLVTDGKSYAIWELGEVSCLKRLERKPEFKLVSSHPTWDEAETERQRLKGAMKRRKSDLFSSM
jgi:hypothetical protein